MTSRQSRWRHDNRQVRVNIDATLVAIFRIIIYRLLMRSTHDHEDRVRYWLTDNVAVGGGQPILDKVFMVMSRPKSKVYYCLIKYREFSFRKIVTFIITAFFNRDRCSKFCFLQAERSHRKAISLVDATPLLIGRKQNPEYTAWEHLRSI